MVTLQDWFLLASLLFLGLLSLHLDDFYSTLKAPLSKSYLLHEMNPQPDDSPFHKTESIPWVCFKGVLFLPTLEYNLPVPKPATLLSAP